jgi:autotransporter translocation and assembly factor TamB
MSVMGVTVPQVAGDFVIENSTLSTQSFKILTATGSVEFGGTLALGNTAQNDWRVEIDSLDTDLVVGIIRAFTRNTPPVSGGKLNGTVRARGLWGRVAFDATVSVSSVYVERELVERVDINVKAELPRWTLHTSLVRAATEVLTIDASGTGTSGLQLAINSTPFQLANFRGASRRNLTGAVVVHGEIVGNLKEPEGTLQLVASNVGLDGRQWGDMMLRASGQQGEWTVTAGAFEGALDIDATLRLTSGYPYTLGVQLRGLQFGRLISSDQSLQAVISANVDLKGSAKALASPSGVIRIRQLDISRGQYQVSAPEPIQIDVTDGRFFIRPMVFAGPSSRLNVSGELATSGDIDLRGQGEGNLVLLELIGQPFSSARGEFTAAVQIRRHPDSGWDLSGQGQVRDATLDLGLPVAFTDVNGDFTLAGSSVRIENLDGKAGGGQFHVAGRVSLNQGPDVAWKIQEISVSSSQGLEAEVSGAGRVQGTWSAIAVTGDVEIISALYDRNIELTDFLPSFREQVQPAPRTKPPTIEVHLDLHIHAPGGLYIDNNVAKVELGADLRLDGTAEKPQVTGTVDFLTGEVTFRQRTFRITGGSIDFHDHGRINPTLNISAESQISTVEADYTVTATVTGTADTPRVELSADDPTLTETDIVSLITFGQTTAQLQRQGGGVSPIDAVALLPTGNITAPIAKLIGVNRLEIEAVQSPIAGAGSAGSIQPRVTIGKDLTDRLRASVSTAFGVSTEQMAQLEYRLTRRISLLGSWEGQTTGQAGAFGGDIKFRYEFRRLPFSLLRGGLQSASSENAH